MRGQSCRRAYHDQGVCTAYCACVYFVLCLRLRRMRRKHRVEVLRSGVQECKEQVYITELIAIEEKARSLVVQAIQLERALRELDENHGEEEANEMPAYRRIQANRCC